VFSFDLKTEKKVVQHLAKNGVILAMTQRKDRETELSKWAIGKKD